MTPSRKKGAYRPRTIKRCRRTKAEIAAVDDAVVEVLRQDRPQSLRHVFYRLTSSPYSLVDKTQQGYRAVQNRLLKLRETGRVPWEWISDGTRWRRQRQSFGSRAEALEYLAENYRRDLWRRTPAYVEVWCESESIAGVIFNECDRYGVSVMVSRGFASKTYLHQAAKEIEAEDRPAFLYYVGDWDAAGKIIPEKIEAELRRFAPDADITFTRLAVTPEQIRNWNLPTKPPKRTTHAKDFKGGTVEAEAIPAATMRQLVREAIEQHLNAHEVKVIEIAEESERDGLFALANRIEDIDWANMIGGTA
ncbi:MAG: hypothetical protein CMM60_03125 [Rhodospirillaceae bacterium]|nr:hypothetical protein [Rhodospirillaceae bacterium]